MGLVGGGGVGEETEGVGGPRISRMGTDGLREGAGRRTPCAERAVILTAVQSLRLACMEGASSENAELGLTRRGGGLFGREGVGNGLLESRKCDMG
jgi:hypothetical protein